MTNATATNSCMYADQGQPRNKMGKNTKESQSLRTKLQDSLSDKSGKAPSKNIIPSRTTKRQVIL